MAPHDLLTPALRDAFPLGRAIRYKPGLSTFGYEDCREADGRVPGIVVGYTSTRIQVALTLRGRYGTKRTTVKASTLVVAQS